MKLKLFCALMCILVSGCISWPEAADEHKESNEFSKELRSEPRVAAILLHKPNKVDNGFAIRANSRTIVIFINIPLMIEFSFIPGIPNIDIPGNQYTPEEVAVIEDAALSVKAKLGVERNIRIYDDSIKKGHDAKKLEAGSKPSHYSINRNR